MKAEAIKNSVLFYRCNVCGNLIIKIADSGITPQCCGRDMELLKPGEVDASPEAHVPVYKQEGCKLHIEVGAKLHPMTDMHHIVCIVVKTTTGIHVRELNVSDSPEACLVLCPDEKVISIYEYCSLHGLWKTSCE